jgi:hypothetical protein
MPLLTLRRCGIWPWLLIGLMPLLWTACGESMTENGRFDGIAVERLSMAMPGMPGMDDVDAEVSDNTGAKPASREQSPSQVDASVLAEDSTTLVLILSPECPLCLDYATAFRELTAECAAQGIRVRGVFPGTFFPDKQIRMYLRRFQLEFPAWLDPDYALIHALEATTTPEAILLDAQGQTVYQGGIDNWAYALTRKRLEPTEYYLRDAIAAHLEGRSPDPAYTEPVGCLVE